MIKVVKGKYYVYSKNGEKKLGGPYDTKEAANKRLGQIHYFKNRGKTAMWKEIFKYQLTKCAMEMTPGLEEEFEEGQIVEDINPTCPHKGSIGMAVMVSPSTVTYIVRNEGGTYKPGDELTKTKDQLRVLDFA
tara:strand:+ start:56 stop:454 length:399 start_codon:yes stop_codon:yes gene_type:complete